MLSNSQSTSRVMSLRARECEAVWTRFGMGGSGMQGGVATPVAVFLPATSVVPGVDSWSAVLRVRGRVGLVDVGAGRDRHRPRS